MAVEFEVVPDELSMPQVLRWHFPQYDQQDSTAKLMRLIVSGITHKSSDSMSVFNKKTKVLENDLTYDDGDRPHSQWTGRTHSIFGQPALPVEATHLLKAQFEQAPRSAHGRDFSKSCEIVNFGCLSEFRSVVRGIQ